MCRGKAQRFALEGRGQRAEGRSRSRRRNAVIFCLLPAALCALLLAGCRQKMANQPRYDPLEASTFFEDGMSARPRLAGTVARGELSVDPLFETGRVAGELTDGYPIPVTREVIERGHSRYDIYCAQCHGRVGDGNGMIPSRGYRRPPSFHTEALRAARTGHFFDVMTNGFGAMPPYKSMITAGDRWAIVAYIRALQLSQHATVSDVPASERSSLDQAPGSTAAASSAHGSAGGEH